MTIGKPWFWIQTRITPWDSDWVTISRHRAFSKAQDRLLIKRNEWKNQPLVKHRLVKVQEVR